MPIMPTLMVKRPDGASRKRHRGAVALLMSRYVESVKDFRCPFTMLLIVSANCTRNGGTGGTNNRINDNIARYLDRDSVLRPTITTSSAALPLLESSLARRENCQSV